MNPIKSLLKNIYVQAMELNKKNIESLLDHDPKATFLDLGCDNGTLTVKLAEKIGTKKILGIDIVEERMKKARKLGVKTYNADLDGKFPLRSSSVDAIHANQVIEHMTNIDNFMAETFRVLKPAGYAIVSTENGSSWENIFAAIMGWQIFSSTNISTRTLGLGNPLSLYRGTVIGLESWTHKTIFNIRGLKEFGEVHGFEVDDVKGAGYFPLPAKLGDIDKTHAHFMTFKFRKPCR